MIPLFKSHYSIGNSILTLKLPDATKEGGSDSIFTILKENNEERLVLVEDSLVGFLEAYRNCKELNIKLVFGLRIQVCNDVSQYEKGDCLYKLILFARDPQGIRLLTKIYSEAFTKHVGKIDLNFLDKYFNDTHLQPYVPFYDSFLHSNLTSYKKPCVANLTKFSPVFFIEDNLLPFDPLIKEAVESYCVQNSFLTASAKSIYYKNREDFEAYQTYKCICNRTYAGKRISLNNPNLDHCASPEFCFESYKEHEVS